MSLQKNNVDFRLLEHDKYCIVSVLLMKLKERRASLWPLKVRMVKIKRDDRRDQPFLHTVRNCQLYKRWPLSDIFFFFMGISKPERATLIALKSNCHSNWIESAEVTRRYRLDFSGWFMYRHLSLFVLISSNNQNVIAYSCGDERLRDQCERIRSSLGRWLRRY